MTVHAKISADKLAVGQAPANTQKIRRRMLPAPLRRAVALAIELERTYDQLARHLGHSVPLENRIIIPETGRNHRQRLNLPRDLSGERISQMHQNRLKAIEALHEQIADTMGYGEADHLYQLVEEARTIVYTEGYVRVTKRRAPGRNLDPDDRLSAEELRLVEIGRAADNPPPPSPPAPQLTDPAESLKRGIAVDLLVEGLLVYHRIDRDKLYDAIDAQRRPKRGRNLASDAVFFTSPAMRSNQYPALHAFGPNFPKALFRLHGDHLETQSLEMIAADPAHQHDVWTYRATAPSNITLSRHGLLRHIPIHDLERRALTDVIDDPRFHRALIIDRADRYQGDGLAPLTRLRLRPSYGYIDPPGVHIPRPPIQRPSDVRKIGHGFRGAYHDLEYADAVLLELQKRNVQRRHRIDVIDGGGLALRLSDRGQRLLSHRFELKRETLQGGPDAIGARIDNILEFLRNGSRRRPAMGTPLPAKPKTQSPKLNETKTQRLIRIHGLTCLEDWNACTRIGALLYDRLTLADVEADHDTEFHLQEGLLAIRSIRLNRELHYRLERFDRVLGKISYAIGVLEIEKDMSPASIEALRDGVASQVIPDLCEFGQAQVRKISKHDGLTMVTLRVPLFDKPSD